ncbi:hypothetical protein G4G27_17305 [Sphingomonas sp. So64.6b]|nr:hypothetical protein [Sphingomonas sp. So64.6b]QNA82567.1 hypothetical protein G4G27_17305 [Sphingomonas sp. So64.6b]
MPNFACILSQNISQGAMPGTKAQSCPVLGPAAARIEHRCGGLVGKQLVAALQVGEQVIAQRRDA